MNAVAIEAELREFLSRNETSVGELRFAAYTLHIAIQAALDVAAHIVADNRGDRREDPPRSSG